MDPHPNWSRDRQHIFYYGRAREARYPTGVAGGGYHIGVADWSGQIVWEHHFPQSYYYRVSTHTKRRGNCRQPVTPDLVTGLHYADLDSSGVSRIGVLARCGSLVGKMPGQQSHPHLPMSPGGQWLCDNSGDDSRADVYVVRLN